MSICTGPEMGPSPADGSLRFRNVRPAAWPGTASGPCAQASANDLRKDAALGLWTPPVEAACVFERFDSQSVSIGLAFGAWDVPVSGDFTPFPADACSGYQIMVVSSFTLNADVPQNAGVSWVLACQDAPMTIPPSSSHLEHGRIEGWADAGIPSGTVWPGARTDTLTRYFYVAAGATLQVYQSIAVTAYENGTGIASPTVLRAVIDTVAYRFDAVGGPTSPPL